MRALLEERVHKGAKGTLLFLYKSWPISELYVLLVSANTLYFGCRSAAKDQHYGGEWRQTADAGALVYRTAFSRDGPEGIARTYVQDRILEDAQRVWRLVGEEGAWIYISG